jgi:hypothetical protein
MKGRHGGVVRIGRDGKAVVDTLQMAYIGREFISTEIIHSFVETHM